VNAAPVPAEAAETAVARLREMSADLRGCALLGSDGQVLAASGDRDRWAAAAADLLAAADEAGDEPASHVHVATEDGEAFAVREDGLAMVAVTERFTLASLMIFDMRAVLRDLAREGA
jgi:predicted regulator of Ras-like GTPase activity (Roadblock/LC7/MglB family)